jgi:L-aspartate oxidase
VLRDRIGRRFMVGLHPLADLAPRDVVAAAITATMAETAAACVYLDATTLPDFATRFPTVHAACRAAGVDPRTEPIPVTPAAHYTCGGVVTDLHGRTAVRGLYAAGEVARTGLHGANRLASNSLLEGLVMGARTAAAVLADRAEPRPARHPVLVASPAMPIAPRPVVQRAMSAAAGIGRSAAGLAAASDAVEAVTELGVPGDRAGVEDAALTVLAQAVLAAAGSRTESRGCHRRTDFPDRDDRWQRSSLHVCLDESGNAVVRPAVLAAGSAA